MPSTTVLRRGRPSAEASGTRLASPGPRRCTATVMCCQTIAELAIVQKATISHRAGGDDKPSTNPTVLTSSLSGVFSISPASPEPIQSFRFSSWIAGGFTADAFCERRGVPVEVEGLLHARLGERRRLRLAARPVHGPAEQRRRALAHLVTGVGEQVDDVLDPANPSNWLKSIATRRVYGNFRQSNSPVARASSMVRSRRRRSMSVAMSRWRNACSAPCENAGGTGSLPAPVPRYHRFQLSVESIVEALLSMPTLKGEKLRVWLRHDDAPPAMTRSVGFSA
jgi:hypothetical protein